MKVIGDFIVRAWTGGSQPPYPLPPAVDLLATALFGQQLESYQKHWLREPDRDTKTVFYNRAKLDAWATLRGEDQ